MQLTVAVLGPLGTYTHEAAFKLFGPHVDYNQQPTIKDVFGALTSVHVGVVPQENSIFGSVVETYDALRQAGFVCGEVTLQVQHCLLVRQGVKLDDIRKIFSHEQALGQCKAFIASHLPSAALVKTPSTAAAARMLLDSPPDCAAICSRVCGTLFDGLSVLHEGIQDIAANFTRFYVITKNKETTAPQWLPKISPGRALISISPPIPLHSGAQAMDISLLLSALQINITRIDRRPSLEISPFHDIYIIETTSAEKGVITTEGQCNWKIEVDMAIQRVEEAGGYARLLGFW